MPIFKAALYANTIFAHNFGSAHSSSVKFNNIR
jgi:hypothetical protein